MNDLPTFAHSPCGASLSTAVVNEGYKRTIVIQNIGRSTAIDLSLGCLKF